MRKLLLPLLIVFISCACGTDTKKDYTQSDRSIYETDLRNSFLDEGLDIKVDVAGVENDTLKLEFSLFNDVWARKFSTEGAYKKWSDMGFKYITITDGYDYKHNEDLKYGVVETIQSKAQNSSN